MNKIKAMLGIATLLLTFGLGVSYGPHVSADLLGGVCTKDANSANNPENSTVCQDKASTSNPLTSSKGVLAKVSSIIAFFAGIVAIIMSLFAGGEMVGSGGDPNKVKQARTKLLHALTGLVIIALAQTILLLIINSVLN
jgi:hypothetical protein